MSLGAQEVAAAGAMKPGDGAFNGISKVRSDTGCQVYPLHAHQRSGMPCVSVDLLGCFSSVL